MNELSVLIIDRFPNSLSMLSNLLADRLNINSVTATSTPQAVKLLQHFQFEVVISELFDSNQIGLEVTEAMRGQKSIPALIFFTSEDLPLQAFSQNDIHCVTVGKRNTEELLTTTAKVLVKRWAIENDE